MPSDSPASIPSETDAPASPRRVQRVRHEIVRRALRVARVEPLGPGFRRITLAGPELAGFVSASFDDHLKFILEPGTEAQSMRDYTPRHFDPQTQELTLEFVLHGDGPATTWAAQAQVGQPAFIAGPRGSSVIPMDFAWHLLAGDASALPAIARRLEELPAGACAIAIVAMPNPDDRRALRSAADLTLQWVDSDRDLVAAVRALALPPGEGFAWCGAEAATAATVRAVLVEEKGHDRHAVTASAYWRAGTAG